MIREDVGACYLSNVNEDWSTEKITTDEFIDVLIGTRKYIPCLCKYVFCIDVLVLMIIGAQDVYNKIDAISLEQMDKIARMENTVVISCELGLK